MSLKSCEFNLKSSGIFQAARAHNVNMSRLKGNKLYFLVESSQFFYCVPSKDVMTVDAAAVELNEDIPFRYNSLSLNGTVLFISSK